ncbi:MAG: GNAT family N-acetyltransferase [Alphaproteobacteria bacterium]|nr:GNAT family N-acetyltransferase [Alphaproteobacteria bacterium]
MSVAPFALIGLDHVVLRVPDMERALDFYVGVLGAVEERRIDRIGLVQLRVGRSLIDLIDLAKWAKDTKLAPESFNVDHICLRIDPFEEAQITRHLTMHGIEIHEQGDRYGAEGDGPSVYIRDPFQNVIELKGPAKPKAVAEPILRTERLILRPIRMSDAHALFPLFSDPDTMQHWSHAPLTRIDEMQTRIAHNLPPQSKPAFSFAITKDGERALGWINFYNENHGIAGLGYILAAAQRGNGYVAEAVEAMLTHGFKTLKLHRVYLDIDPQNARSVAVAERAGFRREGLFRQAFFRDGEYLDSVFYAMLYEEWLARQR